MVKLHRFVCRDCDTVQFTDEWEEDCSECGGSLKSEHTPEHDRKIMTQPDYECPTCGDASALASNEQGTGWVCDSSLGGCGETDIIQKDNSIPEPNDASFEEAVRYDAWSRYQRYLEDEFDYDRHV
jgi:ribosomal protein S27AE